MLNYAMPKEYSLQKLVLIALKSRSSAVEIAWVSIVLLCLKAIVFKYLLSDMDFSNNLED